MNSVEEVLKHAVEYEKSNKWDMAARCYFKALNLAPNNKDILFNLGSCLFSKGDFEQALDVLVESYRHPAQTGETKQVILNYILTAYYEPNALTFKANYEKNYGQFRNYEFNYIRDFLCFDSLPYYFIPASNEKLYIFEKKTGNFFKKILINNIPATYELSPGECVVAINIFEPHVLEFLLKQTFDSKWEPGEKTPVYVIWEDRMLKYAYLQLFDYASQILTGRIIFFDIYSPDSVYAEFLGDSQAYFPIKILGDQNHFSGMNKLLIDISNSQNLSLSNKMNEIVEYYGQRDQQYFREIFNAPSKMRILFYTTRFSDVVQYGTRDFMNACIKLGICCELLIEKSDLHQTTNEVLLGKISEFKPDLVFRINYFKFDFGIFIDNLIVVTWVQDPVIQITSTEHAQKFGPNDYILSHAPLFTNKMIKTGFPPEKIFSLTVPIDETVFYPREIAESEIKQFAADVAVCGNYATNPEQIIKDILENVIQYETNTAMKEKSTCFFKDLYDSLQTIVENGELILNVEQCKKIMDRLAVKYSTSDYIELAETIFLRLGYGLHRKDIVQALCNTSFKLKIWGKNWDQIPELVPYCMGWVNHGEDLGKVYSSSKIVIGATSHFTAHVRIWESIACGALCMIRFVPSEFDILDIRDYLAEGDGFIFYYNKQDLIDKIGYYLKHEDERIRLVTQGQKKVLEKLTYMSAVKLWLAFVRNDLNRKNVAVGETL